MAKSSRKCKCIKETTVNGVKVGNIYEYQDYAKAKIIRVNETSVSYEPLFCNIAYFNEHFMEVSDGK